MPGLRSLLDAGKGRSGTTDPSNLAVYTTPFLARTSEGHYLTSRSVWLYMALPRNHYDFESRNEKILVGTKIAQLLVELGATSRAPLGPSGLGGRNRQVHLACLAWSKRELVPARTIPRLGPLISESFLTAPSQETALVVGVELWPHRGQTKHSGLSLGKSLVGAVRSYFDVEYPDMNEYAADDRMVRAILSNHGARLLVPEEQAQLEAWYSKGEARDAELEVGMGDDSLLVDVNGQQEVIQMSALTGLESEMAHPPDMPWVHEALMHRNGACVVSIRCELQPAEVVRSRARKSERRAITQINEQVQAQDLERKEDSDLFALGKMVEDYYAGSAEPGVAKMSVVFGQRISDMEPNDHETFRDYLRSVFGMNITVLKHRQAEALHETLPGSELRAAPYQPFEHDANVRFLADAALGVSCELGDQQGLYFGRALPHQKPIYLDVFGAAEKNRPGGMVIVGESGSGKAQPLHAQILTPTGWITMGEISVGDEVIGADGKAHRVLGVFPQGEKEIFRVTFNDNSSVECCDDHLWAVNTATRLHRREPWVVKPLSELRADLTLPDGRAKWHIPIAEPVEFEEADLPLDPYLVGAAIAGGGVDLQTGLSSADDRFAAAEADLRLVPAEYLRGSVSQRRALLQGLLDGGGDCSPAGGMSLETSSADIRDDVLELVRTLGGVATVTEKPLTATSTEMCEGQHAYKVSIELPDDWCPFRLPAKAERWQVCSRRRPERLIVDVTRSHTAAAQCILIDAPDHLYLTDNLVVTHNTFLLSMLSWQAVRAGLDVVLINPKGQDSMAHIAGSLDGVVVNLSVGQLTPGQFDPFRYAPPAVAGDIAKEFILGSLAVGDGAIDKRAEIAVGRGIAKGVGMGARCVGQAIDGIDDRQLKEMIWDWWSASPAFAAGIARAPLPDVSARQGGFTLIEFQDLSLPEPGQPARDRNNDQTTAIAVLRLVTRTAEEMLVRAGGGILAVDEAWSFFDASSGSLQAMQSIGRRARSLGLLPIFAVQRLSDVREAEMESHISRVVVMATRDRDQARAGIEWAGMEATPERIRFIETAWAGAPDAVHPAGKPSMGFMRDLEGRHGAFMVWPVPPELRRLLSAGVDKLLREAAERARRKTEVEAEISAQTAAAARANGVAAAGQDVAPSIRQFAPVSHNGRQSRPTSVTPGRLGTAAGHEDVTHRTPKGFPNALSRDMINRHKETSE